MEQPHGSHHRATAKYMTARSESSVQCGWDGTVSQRRSIDAWMIEGTGVLVSTVALFGKVSAGRAVEFV